MIRLAKIEDLDEIMRVYDIARQFMRANGNMLQWVNGYPQRECLEQDIEKKQAYVCEVDEKVRGIFVLQIGEDETYAEIEGAWKNNEPYGTIHRIGSDGTVKGVFDECIAFAKIKCDNLRIDTHESNPIMQHLIKKNEFEYCGIIYVEGLSPRMAFQYVK